MPHPDLLVVDSASLKITIITDEGGTLTTSFRSKLESEGQKTVILNLNHAKSRSIDLDRTVSVAGDSDEDMKTAINTIFSKYGTIGRFVHLHPHFEFSGHQFTQHFEEERKIVKKVFFLAKHLQPHLDKASKTQRASFMTVTRLDGQFGTARRSNISIIGGGLSGLTKCLNLEWSPVFCRAVDVQPEINSKKMAALLFSELHDADLSHIDIGLTKLGRNTYNVVTELVDPYVPIKTSVSKETVFLVSGGGRGVTASCVKELAKAYQSKFILLGRSDLAGTLPEFALKEANEGKLKALIMTDLKAKGQKVDLKLLKKEFSWITAKKEIEQTIKAIKSVGGDAVYVSGDVTNLKIKPELLKIEANWGKVTGLIHGAGRLADKLIQNKSESDFQNVTSVKIDGLLNLLKMVDLNKLEHLVLFSSVAGFYGNIGQSDYAISNEILSTCAHLFRTNHPNTKVSAINWGAWEGGMVSPELQKKFEEAGVTLVNHLGGAAMFVNEFNKNYEGQPQVIIGGTLPTGISDISSKLETYIVQRNLSLEANPFLNHHAIQGNPVLPMVSAISWMSDTCHKLFPDYRPSQVKDAKLYKGIVFDGSEKSTYFTAVKELSKSKDKLEFQVTVYSKGTKLPTNHYRALITLEKGRLEQPTFQPPTTNGVLRKGEEYYKSGALFHGLYFQGIKEVLKMTEKEVVLRCKAKKVPHNAQGQFPINTLNSFFLDIQYQGMVVWVQKYRNGANSLPLQTKIAKIFKKLPFDKELFVRIEIIESSATKMIANCTVYNENNEVYLITNGAGLTISKGLVW